MGPVWPGTRISLQEDANGLTVERSWLYLWEARVHIQLVPGGWEVSPSVRFGPGEAAQGIAGVLMPGVIVALLALRASRVIG